ncbi:hypothetical protein LEP1GSC187_3067 [Leptospira santarosai str. ZUN179]|uniref:Uncharacterized protein n=1 Tax=Leptospira santarosai str. ZUN179 TaxID=1049985 RepID=M6USC0_9LEPT|nr:hypothetical protein LEP1GSC187_3067 [Leptospira santarosai str. ZUN179]
MGTPSFPFSGFGARFCRNSFLPYKNELLILHSVFRLENLEHSLRIVGTTALQEIQVQTNV